MTANQLRVNVDAGFEHRRQALVALLAHSYDANSLLWIDKGTRFSWVPWSNPHFKGVDRFYIKLWSLLLADGICCNIICCDEWVSWGSSGLHAAFIEENFLKYVPEGRLS